VNSATQATEAAPQPTAIGESHPLITRTGNEEIDPIIDAVARGDVQKLRSFIQFTTAECTKLEGLGGPPKCQEGEAEGTPIEVLPFLGPEGSFVRKAEIENWLEIRASGLYAIYQVSSEAYSDVNYPSGEFAIIFIEKQTASAVSVQVSDGKIVRVDYILDTSPEVLNVVVQRNAAKMILAPPA